MIRKLNFPCWQTGLPSLLSYRQTKKICMVGILWYYSGIVESSSHYVGAAYVNTECGNRKYSVNFLHKDRGCLHKIELKSLALNHGLVGVLCDLQSWVSVSNHSNLKSFIDIFQETWFPPRVKGCHAVHLHVIQVAWDSSTLVAVDHFCLLYTSRCV